MQRWLLAIATILAGCGSDSHALPDSATVDGRGRAIDAPVDAPPVTGWTAPTGMALQGVTFADGWGDLRALSPALVITGGWTDSLYATGDGEHLVFAYDQVDFSAFFLTDGASQLLTGPEIANMAEPSFEMFEADLGQADWTFHAHPVDALAPGAVLASPALNESGDLMIYTEFTLPSGRSQLYYSQLANGVWSAPAKLAFDSSSCNDDNAKIAGELATSVTIYFESNRGDAAGTGTICADRTLYTTTYANGTFSPVAKVPGIEVTNSDDSQPFLTRDGSTMLWTSVRTAGYGVFAATKTGAMFANAHPIALPTQASPYAGNVSILGEASIVELPEGDLLYMMCGLATNVANGMTFHDADHLQLIPCVARRPH